MDINLEQMKELIDVLEDSTLTEISLEEEGYKITLKKNYSGNTGPSGSEIDSGTKEKPEGSATKEDETRLSDRESESREDDLIPVTSPIVGTFYRKPAPDSPPYVEIGDRVEAEDTICIVEAMKVMNEVKADSRGLVEEIYVEDGEPVEYGETLFLLKPLTDEAEDKDET